MSDNRVEEFVNKFPDEFNELVEVFKKFNFKANDKEQVLENSNVEIDNCVDKIKKNLSEDSEFKLMNEKAKKDLLNELKEKAFKKIQETELKKKDSDKKKEAIINLIKQNFGENIKKEDLLKILNNIEGKGLKSEKEIIGLIKEEKEKSSNEISENKTKETKPEIIVEKTSNQIKQEQKNGNEKDKGGLSGFIMGNKKDEKPKSIFSANNKEDKVVDNKVVDNKVTDNKVVDNKVVDNKVVDNKVVDNKVVDNKVVETNIKTKPKLDIKKDEKTTIQVEEKSKSALNAFSNINTKIVEEPQKNFIAEAENKQAKEKNNISR